MNNIKQHLADALVQAAMEGDESPKVMVSMRVLEILTGNEPRRVEVEPMPIRGEELRAALAVKGRSQSELARRLGLHVSAINKICSGDRDVKASEAEAIAAYLIETMDGPAVFVPTVLPSQRLRAARRHAGMTAKQIAEQLDLSESAVRNQENGTNGIPSPLAAKYAEAYGVSPGWIMFGDQVAPTQHTVAE